MNSQNLDLLDVTIYHGRTDINFFPLHNHHFFHDSYFGVSIVGYPFLHARAHKPWKSLLLYILLNNATT